MKLLRKVFFYFKQFGISRTLSYVRANLHMYAYRDFKGHRWINPNCRDKDFLKDIGWNRMSKRGKRKMSALFEIDHMNQKCYDSRWHNLERKRGVDNNYEALIARGGNHKGSLEDAFVSNKVSVLDEFFQ